MEEPDTSRQFEIKEGIAFLIDLSELLFVPVNELDHRSQLLEILQCINDLMSDMVITFPSNGIGIYFYNARETGKKFPKNSGITKAFSLNDLNSSNIKLLTNIVRDELDGFKPLQDRYPDAEKQLDNLHTVLETLLKEFQAKPQYNRKRLFWLTNSDKPYINPNLKDGLRTVMSDFEANRILVSPVFLETYPRDGDQKFDLLLYENIFLNTNFLARAQKNQEEGSPLLNTTVSSQIRLSILRLKEVRRIQFSCDLVLSDGPGIGGKFGCSVKGYTLFNHESIRQFRQVYTGGEGLKLVHHDTSYLRSDTKESLDLDKESQPTQTLKGISVKFANDKEGVAENEKLLLFKQDVVEYMRGYSFDHTPGEQSEDEQDGNDNDDDDNSEDDDESDRKPVPFSNPPYLKLLCFRDISKFQHLFNIKPPVFITADSSDGMNSTSKEGGYSNSFNTFRLLYQLCLRLQRYAVLFGCVKRNSSPSLYALYPTNTEGSSTEIKDKQFPDGFLLITLPWLSEIRSLPDYMLTEHHRYFLPETESVVPPELASLCLKLMGLCKVDDSYDPSVHPNPVLNYFYKTIKQEALQIDIKDEDTSLEQNDWTVSRLLSIRNLLQENVDTRQILQFINVYLNKIGNAEVAKRTNEDNNSGALKRAKAAPLTEAAIVALWQTNSWSKVTVAQLKEFMGKYPEIPLATRKADMVANITSFLESRQ